MVKTPLRLLAGTVTTIGLIAALGLVALLVVVPRVAGATTLTVLSGSMEPTIPVGSLVLIRPVDPTTLEVGDIITFQAAPGVKELITHRVIELQPRTTPPSFITKGDNNAGADLEPTPVGAVRGEVWFHVPYVGNLAGHVKGPIAVGILLLLGGALLLSHLLGRLRAVTRKQEAVEPEPAGSESR